MQLNNKQSFTTIIKWLVLPLILSIGFGCSSLSTIDRDEGLKEPTEYWRSDPFKRRPIRIAPVVTKTVILPDKQSEEEPEK